MIDKKLRPLPIAALSEWSHWWHASDDILIYLSEDKNTLLLLDTSSMSFRELSFSVQSPVYDYHGLAWSPNGEKIAFVREDGSVWQVDYPKLENVEQLTPSLPEMDGMRWSPDGNFIVFMSGPDIYVVDTMK